MLLVNKLKNIEGFSETEKTLARFVLEKPSDVMQMNIEAFSSANFVSNSTIVRFCQKLGFKGFSDFKINLASEINTFTILEDRIEVDMPFSNEDSFDSLPKTFLNLYYQTLTDIYPHINMNEIQKIAKVLNNADLISLWAKGPSLVLAQDFYYKIKRIGYVSTIDQLSGFDHVVSTRRSRNEVALIVTTYGISDSVKHWLEHHKKFGNTTIMVCLNPSSPYIKLADHTVILDTFEERLMKQGHFASKTAMSYILDLIYASMFKLDYKEHIEILNNAR